MRISVSVEGQLEEILTEIAESLQVSRPRVLRALLKRFVAEAEEEDLQEEARKKLKPYTL